MLEQLSQTEVTLEYGDCLQSKLFNEVCNKAPFGILNPVVRPFCISMFSRCYWFFDHKLLFNKGNILDVISGCSLGVGDRRILCLLHRILQLSAIAYDYFSFFSQYSLVTLHLSPATKILIENPVI